MAVEYERLENEAKKLPQQTPSSLTVNRLNTFLLDCAINPQMKSDYDNTMSVFEWTDSTATYINFAYDLFKISNMSTLTQQRSRKLTLAYQIANGVENIRTEPSSSPHFAFVDVLEKYFRICNTKPIKQGDIPFEFKLYHNFIERSVLSCIIEIKYFVVPKSRTSDGQMVCMQKMLWLINNGVIEYLHVVAPHEDWHYEDCAGIVGKKQANFGEIFKLILINF
ncbi:unnamed protein product [Meloidogyne enterolobii]|uniref:Uncharacterized protein n=1 Tax=Meloidogyne enterolobii TaxID=390850 RepID=A0ACB0YQ31_MELEN